jgi:hypothetical protein
VGKKPEAELMPKAKREAGPGMDAGPKSIAERNAASGIQAIESDGS